ncbi:ABC transporter permease [Paraliobacillus quinghaiensis]|uniref:ABC transporter permease n=1 Tax=Paraliobacillus quinghaiensis TaxID=470815 RepID=UPI0027E5585F|nr:ABC transporter permease [Paraliobacillus quinghaiensis]
MLLSNFIRLIQNENMKLYSKKATWVMIGILAIIVLAVGLILRFMDDNNLKEYGDDWREELQVENASVQNDNGDYTEASYRVNIEKNKYHLENDIKPQSYGAMQFVYDNIGLAMLISLFTIIVAAGILANEFQWGTIKLLLIRPVTRLKILASKYVAVLIYALTLLVFLVVFSWIVGALLFGINGLNPSAVMYDINGYKQVSLLPEIIEGFGYRMVNLVMMATFAFMISAVFRNTSMAIGIAIFLMLAGNTIIPFVSQYSWAKYILFANTDLSQYQSGGHPLLDGMSLSFSISVLLVYYVIFIVASWLSFTKRDIAGQ